MAAHYTGELTTPSFFIGFLEYLQQSLFSLQAYAFGCVWRFFYFFFFLLWQLALTTKYIYFYICKALKFYICFPLYIIIGIKANIQSAPHCLALEHSLLQNFQVATTLHLLDKPVILCTQRNYEICLHTNKSKNLLGV